MKNCNGKKVYVLLLLVLCLISFGLGYYLFKYTAFKEVKPIPVQPSLSLDIKPLISRDIVVESNYVGHAEAINMVQIIPYVSGYLDKITVKEGENVCKNDLLLNIDPSEYKAKFDAAEAAILKAKASLDYNKNYYKRIKKSGSRAFSEIDLDNALNALLQAEAEYKNAKANRDAAEVNYQRTNIKAPICGLVGNFNLSIGDYVSPESGTLLTIVQTDPIRIVFSLTDVAYLNMKKDSPELFKDTVIRLKTANGEYLDCNGEFKYTDNQIDKKTNSLAIYTHFSNKNNILMPNSFVTVILEKTFKNTVLIDKNFVTMKADGSFVNVVRNNHIFSHPVNILSDKENSYIVANDFENGDFLLLDEVKNITPDTKLIFNIIKE